jgi:hypothetical protein
MVNLDAHPALKKYVGSVEAGADVGVLEAELKAAKEELAQLPKEVQDSILKELAHIKGLGPAAEQALEGKEVVPNVQGGRPRAKGKSKKKKSKSPKKKSKSPKKKPHKH